MEQVTVELNASRLDNLDDGIDKAHLRIILQTNYFDLTSTCFMPLKDT